jgi:transposase-like protein
MARAKQPKPIHQMTIAEWEKAFPGEDACCAYLAGRRWPEGVACPRCGNTKVKRHGTMQWNWLCNECSPSATNYRFSHITGTIFENTNKPLRQWFRVIHLMLTSKKGMSALQIYRYMGFGSYRTAWLMCHKVRTALMQDIDKLGGIVEVDETFVGGLAKNRHWDKRGGGGGTGGIGSGKTPIVGAVSRKGNVVARVVANITSDTLTREAVSHKVSLLCTDQYPGYNPLDRDYPHATIDHARGQYVIGAIHTQTIEGFWSIFKRGVVGTFHKMSRKYMPLYVAEFPEFQFRYNNRENADIFGTAIKGC